MNRVCYFYKWRLGTLCCFETPCDCFIFYKWQNYQKWLV